LKYCQLPEKSRLSFNIVLIVQESNAEIVIGTVSINLFKQSGRFKSGLHELNVWPFYHIDERLGCMNEFNGLTLK
jgi:hypothetical protein